MQKGEQEYIVNRKHKLGIMTNMSLVVLFVTIVIMGKVFQYLIIFIN